MNETKDFQPGDLVWAKMKGYPYWPAMIVNPPRNVSAIPSKKYVLFFGDCQSAWITEKQLMSLDENFEKLSKNKKVKFQVALAAVEKFRTFFVKLEDGCKSKKANLEVRRKMLIKYSNVSRKEMEQIALMKRKIKKECDAIEKEERLITDQFGLTNGDVVSNVVKKEKNSATYDPTNHPDLSEEYTGPSVPHNEDLLRNNDRRYFPLRCVSREITQKSNGRIDSKEIFLPAGDGPSTSRETFGFEYHGEDVFQDTCCNHHVPATSISSATHPNMKETCLKEEFLPAGDGPSTSRETFGKDYHNAQQNFLERLDLRNTASFQNGMMISPTTEKSGERVEKPTLAVFQKDDLNKKKLRGASKKSSNPALGNAQNPQEKVSPSCVKSKRSNAESSQANLSKDQNKSTTKSTNSEAKKKDAQSEFLEKLDLRNTASEERHFVPIESSDVPAEIKKPPVFPMYNLIQVLSSYYWKTFWGTDFGKNVPKQDDA